MAVIEKELPISMLSALEKAVAKDKLRKIPVIKYIRHGFLQELALRYFINPYATKFIGITGESASGKSTFVKAICSKIKEIEQIKNKSYLNFISTDNYFNDISAKITKYGSFNQYLEAENYNPDAPSSFQLDLMREHLQCLYNKQDVMIPEYKLNGSGMSVPDAISVTHAPLIISEGIAVFYPKVRDMFDVKFYVEVDEKVRIERYIKRAKEKRNQTKEDALEQYDIINKSAKIYLRPQRKYADVIINGDAQIDDFIDIAQEFANCF